MLVVQLFICQSFLDEDMVEVSTVDVEVRGAVFEVEVGVEGLLLHDVAGFVGPEYEELGVHGEGLDLGV
ncbi:unnamed protein product [Calypogeia fissa]